MLIETVLTVRYEETDQMGIVHHSVYPVWFEIGRTEFIKAAGIRYSELEKMGVRLPLIGLMCKYKSYAEYEDTITIGTWIKYLSNTRITFQYRALKNKEPAVIASGETEHVWTDKALKPFNMKKRYPELYEMLKGLAPIGKTEGKGGSID